MCVLGVFKIPVWWRRAVLPSLPWVVCFLSFFLCLVLWFCVSLLCDRHRPFCVHPYRVGVPSRRSHQRTDGASGRALCTPGPRQRHLSKCRRMASSASRSRSTIYCVGLGWPPQSIGRRRHASALAPDLHTLHSSRRCRHRERGRRERAWREGDREQGLHQCAKRDYMLSLLRFRLPRLDHLGQQLVRQVLSVA